MSRRSIGLAAIVITSLVAWPRGLSAQDAARPTLTVVPFEYSRTARSSGERGDALADDLAERLVESGRYRVLDRAWLPVPKTTKGPLPLPSLRRAATAAGVEYLVLGSLFQSYSVVRRPPAISLPLGLLGARIAGARGLVPTPPVMTGQPLVTLDITVIDARSGDVVRTTTVRNASGWPEAMTGIAEVLTRLAPQLTRDVR